MNGLNNQILIKSSVTIKGNWVRKVFKKAPNDEILMKPSNEENSKPDGVWTHEIKNYRPTDMAIGVYVQRCVYILNFLSSLVFYNNHKYVISGSLENQKSMNVVEMSKEYPNRLSAIGKSTINLYKV